MKKTHILISITFLMCLNVNAQLVVFLKNIKVSKTNVPILKDHYREGDIDGPYIQFFFALKNNTDSIIKLHPSRSEMTFEFKFKKETYYQKLIPVIFMEKDSILIPPHQQYESFVGVDIFLGTFILKKNNNDYRTELIEVLPTIKLVYKEKGLKVISSGILDVEVIDNKNLDNL